MSYFSCEHITKYYDGAPVVEDITLSLAQGELVCLLGPSGGGKTTLMSVLSGVEKPDTGCVMLTDEDITGLPGRVSYMLQKDLLLPYKTIVDNVSLPLLLGGVPKQQARSTAAEQFELFGLGGCEKKYPHQLSGGMRQRAALLRTHLSGRGVMLLDEPFSALDAITRQQMQEWYLKIIHRLRATTLLITHDIDEALLLADRIYILTGVPGQISAEFQVHAPAERGVAFSTSTEFLGLKREIWKAIEG